MLPNCELVNGKDAQYLVFKGNDLISNSLRTNGVYEPELLEVAKRIMNRHKSGLVLDIGANIGTFCIPLAKTNPHLTFHSFEPQRIIYYQLCGNTLINGLDNVHCHNFGLSDKRDRFDIELPDYATDGNIGAFSIDKQVRETEYECQTKGKKEEMVVMPLDDGQHRDVRLIKIDVEGHELEVLQGGIKTILNNIYPPIIFEAWTWKPWYQEKRKALFDYLKDLGYEITEIGQNNLAQNKKHSDLLKLEVIHG